MNTMATVRALTVGFGLAAATPSASMAAVAPDAPIATTRDGVIEGGVRDEVNEFKGIPFAAPPVRELRWAAPRPAGRWTGIRSAREFGPACPQPQRSGARHLASINEDCLYLNVYAPAGRDHLPVMVWIHGGSFTAGSASTDFYDGGNLARHGVMVVTVNYRLGRLGWFTNSAISRAAGARPQANWGLLDQIAALRWVKRNASAFGGDPRNVTVFGESAGGIAVNLLMAAPQARGLFQKAIVQSGIGREELRSLEEVRSAGDAFAVAKGLAAEDLDAQRNLPISQVVDAAPPLGAFGPIRDGRLIRRGELAAFERHREARIPYIVGINDDEATLFVGAATGAAPVRGAVAAARDAGHERSSTPTGSSKARQELTERHFREPAHALARAHAASGSPTYVYEFAYVPRYRLATSDGAGHGDELQFVFGNFGTRDPGPFDDADRAVAETVATFWTNFAKRGDPTDTGLPEWAPFGQGGEPVLRFARDGVRIIDTRRPARPEDTRP